MPRKTFLALFTIAAVMRVLFIARAPLWYDENFTLILARLPFDRMIDATAGDVHPPLWYVIEWMLYHAAPNLPAWAIRLPALVFSLLAFLTFAKLISVLQIPQRIQVPALVCMAIMPTQLWYAQEGRMYAMLEFLVLAALYLGLKRRWFLFALTTISMVYTQNYGVIYCAVIGVILLVVLDWSREQFDYFVLAVVATVAAYLPWALVVVSQMDEIKNRYWIMDVSPGAVLNTIYKLFWASAVIQPGIVAAYAVTFVALILGVTAIMREKVRAWWMVLTMAFAPVGIAWVASMLWQPILLFRPLIGISPFLYLIACWPFATVNRQRALYAACYVVPVCMFGIGGYYANIADMKGEGSDTPLLGTLDYIAANWQPGDVLYYADDGPMINLMPYTDLPQYKMPACDPVLGSLSDVTRAALGIHTARLSNVPHSRAWVFAPRSPMHPLCYEAQIADIAPEGGQLITVDDSEYITSGVWLVEK